MHIHKLEEHRGGFNSYHREYKCNSFEWDRCEVFMKDNPVAIPVIKPRDVDDLLDIDYGYRGRPRKSNSC